MDDFRLQIHGSQDDCACNQGFGVLFFNNDFPEVPTWTLGYSFKIFASNMHSQPEKPVAGSLNKSGGVDSQKLSVMSKFKGQLFQLIKCLTNTRLHFIRCIKPNNTHCPGIYN
ncbi:Myosin head, motor domain-containing protein, partial [Cynara cardunculus var. scolymus]